MPRYRRSYGYARKNTRYSRRRRTLSTRNIYVKRSSLAQANQIQALNKKVNAIYRKTKPERKVVRDVAPVTVTLSSNVGGSTQSHMVPLDIQVGADDNMRIGDKVYRRDVFYITLEYFNSSETGYHGSESAGCQFRFVLGQYKTPTNYLNSPSTETIIDAYSTSGTGYTISSIAPLVNGVTEQHKIWKDLKFNMTSTRNQKMLKITTPWYSCRFADAATTNHSWLLVNAAGLHWDSNFSEYVELTVYRKTVFTDA